MNIAEKLIQLRNEKKLTQAEFGKELNIALSSIKNYENVKKPRIPEAKLLLRIAKYYDVSIEYLLDDTLTNRKQENISIEKDLKLNEKSINTIKKINENSFTDSLNFFIGSQSFEIIINKFDIFQKSLIYLDSILEQKRLEDYKNYVENDFNILMDYFKTCQELNKTIKKKIEENCKICKSIFLSQIYTINDCINLYNKIDKIIKVLKSNNSVNIYEALEYIEYINELNKIEGKIRDYQNYIFYTINQEIDKHKQNIIGEQVEMYFNNVYSKNKFFKK